MRISYEIYSKNAIQSHWWRLELKRRKAIHFFPKKKPVDRTAVLCRHDSNQKQRRRLSSTTSPPPKDEPIRKQPGKRNTITHPEQLRRTLRLS